jgi:hypothetical protein
VNAEVRQMTIVLRFETQTRGDLWRETFRVLHAFWRFLP